jgi:hypothetical protein
MWHTKADILHCAKEGEKRPRNDLEYCMSMAFLAFDLDSSSHAYFSTLADTIELDLIDKATLEIRQDEDQTVYTDLEEIADDLPDHSPRFILLSYPLTLVRTNLLPKLLMRKHLMSKQTTDFFVPRRLYYSPPADYPSHTCSSTTFQSLATASCACYTPELRS